MINGEHIATCAKRTFIGELRESSKSDRFGNREKSFAKHERTEARRISERAKEKQTAQRAAAFRIADYAPFFEQISWRLWHTTTQLTESASSRLIKKIRPELHL